MLENPQKTKLKHQYLKKYREMLGISKQLVLHKDPSLKILPPRQLDNQIKPSYLDQIDRINKQRSKSIQYSCHNDSSIQDSSLNCTLNVRKQSTDFNTKIYSAYELNKIIKHAKLCGLLEEQYQSNDTALQENRRYFQEVRNLQQNWHHYYGRNQEERKNYNKIPIEQHYQFKIRSNQNKPNIQKLIEEQRTLFLSQPTQQNDLQFSSSQE